MTESLSTIDELNTICQTQETIIIYGAGVVGSLLVQHILKNGYSDKLFCIAVKSAQNNQNNILGVPVCELKDLDCYKENALFIVGTYENLQVEILEDLENFGCINIKRISNLLCATLRKNETDFSVEIYNMQLREFRKIHEKLTEMENQIDALREFNEICDVNSKSFQGYENRFRDKEIVIMGAGPTLNYYIPIEGAIHIGVNTVYHYEKVKLDYLFACDANRQMNYEERFKGIKKLDCPIFMGRFLRTSPSRNVEFPEDYRMGTNIFNYYLDLRPSKKIYRNICFHPLMNFGSVIFSAIHFALYTYPQKIYLVGCDVNDNGYFFKSDTIIQPPLNYSRQEIWIPGYLRVKEFAKIHYPETEIVSINPVGLKGIFRDIFTDNYLKDQTGEEIKNE